MQYQVRGDLAGIRAEIGKLRTALGDDMDGLLAFQADKYATANIYIRGLWAAFSRLSHYPR